MSENYTSASEGGKDGSNFHYAANSAQSDVEIHEANTDCIRESDSHDPANIDESKSRIKELGMAVKTTTKKVLRVDNKPHHRENQAHPLPRAIHADPMLNPSKRVDVEASTERSIKQKLLKPDSVAEFKDTILHPRAASKQQAAESLAVSENPHLIHDENNALIATHEEFVVTSRKLASMDEFDPEFHEVERRASSLDSEIAVLEKDREEKRSAWISSKYVHCLTAVPNQRYAFPLLSSCRWVDESGQPQGVHWSQWVDQAQNFVKHIPQSPQPQHGPGSGEEIEEGEFDQDLLLQEVERILVSSGPLQRWIARLRRLRNWEEPRASLTWLVIWLLAWFLNRTMSFLYLYLTFRALQTRTDFDKRESLKGALKRAENDKEPYRTFTEMITRFGSSHWLQPTIDAVGPTIQPMLRSTADWLEIMVNYLEWKTDRAAWSVATFLGCLFLTSSLMSTETSFRVLTLGSIMFFFLDGPLSRRSPMYKQVLMPLHWVFWDVPTKTETAFRHLRQRAQEIRTQEEHSKQLDTPYAELFATVCHWNDMPGTVVLTTKHIFFLRTTPRQELWRHSFEDVVEIRKGEGRKSLLNKTKHLITLRFKDGSRRHLEHLKKNDMFFNIIFAFSELQWRQENT